MYLYFSLTGLFNAITTLILGFVVMSKNRHDKVNRLFAYLCFSFSAWSFPYIMWPLAITREDTMFWFQALHYGAILIPLLYYSFALEWLNWKKGYKKILLIFGYILAFVIACYIPSSLFIADMTSRLGMRWWAVPGFVYYIYLLYFFFFYIYSSLLLYLGYRQTTGIKKYQIRYVLLGIVVAIAGGSTNYFLWFDIPIKPYGNIFASFIVIMGAYAIIRYRLLDIRIVLRNVFVNICSLIVTMSVVYIVFYSVVKFFPDHNDTLLILLTSLLSAFVFPAVKHLVYLFVNKYIFTSIHDSQALISDLSHELQSTLDIKSIYRTIYTKLDEAFQLESFAIFGTNKEKGRYRQLYNKHLNLNDHKHLKFSAFFNANYIMKEPQLLLEELKNTAYGPKTKKNIDVIAAYGISIIIPLKIKNQVVGLMVLGAKKSGEAYTKEDLRVLDVVSVQAAIAIENAKLYNEVARQKEVLANQKNELKDLNLNLKGKVDEQTKDIQKKNEYLEGLLNMKNDFLRVVNHQLNTPLSIMRNAYAMVAEKVYKPKEGLDMAEKGLERISETVADFLSAFELEGESMKIEPAETEITNIVNRIAVEKESLRETKAKDLYIKVKEPKFKIPKVFCDPKKIVHVISNLLDNAVFYTEKGGVTVSYELPGGAKSDFLKVLVSDTGAGIGEEDQKSLFKKFSRGSTATGMHPDGSGLGTYIAQKITESSGGELKLEKTKLGRGSVFSFTVPIFKGQKPKKEKQGNYIEEAIDNYKDLKEKEMKENNKKIAKELQPKILLVEDEKNLVDIYHRYFTKKGFDFYVSEDIHDAMNIAKNVKPDVILLDIIIPKKMKDGSINTVAEQGYDFLEMVKADDGTKDIPVIMFTNLDSDKDREKSRKLGAAEYIVKAKAEPKSIVDVVCKVTGRRVVA